MDDLKAPHVVRKRGVYALVPPEVTIQPIVPRWGLPELLSPVTPENSIEVNHLLRGDRTGTANHDRGQGRAR